MTLREHGKSANFGIIYNDVVPPAEVILWIATELVILKARLAYREEREYPEYIDLGGEA